MIELEKELEDEEKEIRKKAEEYEEYYSDFGAKSDKEDRFLKQLSSHLCGEKNEDDSDDSSFSNSSLIAENKGAKLLKSMGWTEGWLRLATNNSSSKLVFPLFFIIILTLF